MAKRKATISKQSEPNKVTGGRSEIKRIDAEICLLDPRKTSQELDHFRTIANFPDKISFSWFEEL